MWSEGKRNSMSNLSSLQERVATMMLDGASLDSVEKEVIERSELNSEQKAAIWLYAWSFVKTQEQRAQAERYLAAVQDAR
jgi:hypothetical protein